MNTTDFGQFAELWAITHQTMAGGKALSNGAMEFCFELLADYPFSLIKQAVKAHAKTAKFAPAPADIISLLEAGNKRPTADEAWGIVPKSEQDSAVWTDEMAAAWLLASPLYYGGDKIGARMTFKSVYERECSEALIMQKPINWWLSRGDNKSHLENTVINAEIRGLLTQQQVRNVLVGNEPPKMNPAALIAKLGGDDEKRKSALAWCHQSKTMLDESEATESEIRRQQLEEQERKKQAVIDRAEQYQRETEAQQNEVFI
jgi:hypothetical protein